MEESNSAVKIKKLLFLAVHELAPGVSREEAASHAIQAYNIASATLAAMGKPKERASFKERKERRASKHALRAAQAACAMDNLRKQRGTQLQLEGL